MMTRSATAGRSRDDDVREVGRLRQRRGVRVAPSAALSALGMSEAAARRSEGDAAVVQLLRDGTIQPHSADVQEPRTGAGADAGEFSEV